MSQRIFDAAVGGGLLGMATAYHLVRAGARTLLLDRADVGRATDAGAGILSPETNSRDPAYKTHVEKLRQAAPSLGVKLVVVEVRDADYDRAFATMVTEGAGALFIVGSPVLRRDRKTIIALAAKHRLPTIYFWREQVEDGGLMAYGSSLAALSRRVAEYIDKILKGAKPADLPSSSRRSSSW